MSDRDERTPNTLQVLASFVYAQLEFSGTGNEYRTDADRLYRAEFDRWLARVKAEAAAEATRSLRDFFAGIDMDAAVDYCEQWAIAYDADRIRRDAGIGGGDGS